MKRSDINRLVSDAKACFSGHGWTLPPTPRWDVTDFGLGAWREHGLVLVNLCEEPEYCEKLMYAKRGMKTPSHSHRIKKEDIICRWGELRIRLSLHPEVLGASTAIYKVDGLTYELSAPTDLVIPAGSRITLFPGVFHLFEPLTEECILGEVSTANDDLHDNVFLDAEVGRFSQINEDEPAEQRLIGEADMNS